METVQFEPMSVGRIFDRAFAIYRNNFLRFVTIVAIIEVPLALLSTATSSWTDVTVPANPFTVSDQAPAPPEPDSPTNPADTSDEAPDLLGFVGSAVTILLTLVGTMLCQAALARNVSETYLGHEITIGQAYGLVLPKALTLIAAALCVPLVVAFGFLLLFVPGVLFSLWFFLTMPAIVVESRSVTSGMSRSKALVAGNLGKVMAVGFLSAVITFMLEMLLGGFAGLIGFFLGDHPALRLFVIDGAGTISQILTMPIGAAAAILLYYDLRIRKEGFDLQMLAQSMTSGQGELRAS